MDDAWADLVTTLNYLGAYQDESHGDTLYVISRVLRRGGFQPSQRELLSDARARIAKVDSPFRSLILGAIDQALDLEEREIFVLERYDGSRVWEAAIRWNNVASPYAWHDSWHEAGVALVGGAGEVFGLSLATGDVFFHAELCGYFQSLYVVSSGDLLVILDGQCVSVYDKHLDLRCWICLRAMTSGKVPSSRNDEPCERTSAAREVQ